MALPRLLVLDLVIVALWGLGVAVGSWALLYLGLLVIGVIVWLNGGLRFRRFRRFSVDLGRALLQLAKFKKPSKRAVRVLAITGGVLVAIIVLNQLSLAAPGKGHGLSVPTNGLEFGFNFSSTGSGAVTVFSWGLILLFVASVWWQLWRPVASLGGTWRRNAFFACLGVFALAPAAFALIQLGAPEDPKANLAFTKVLLRAVLSVVVLAVTSAIALPALGAPTPPARPAPATIVVAQN
jgi:hypothetical protein